MKAIRCIVEVTDLREPGQDRDTVTIVDVSSKGLVETAQYIPFKPQNVCIDVSAINCASRGLGCLIKTGQRFYLDLTPIE